MQHSSSLLPKSISNHVHKPTATVFHRKFIKCDLIHRGSRYNRMDNWIASGDSAKKKKILADSFPLRIFDFEHQHETEIDKKRFSVNTTWAFSVCFSSPRQNSHENPAVSSFLLSRIRQLISPYRSVKAPKPWGKDVNLIAFRCRCWQANDK